MHKTRFPSYIQLSQCLITTIGQVNRVSTVSHRVTLFIFHCIHNLPALQIRLGVQPLVKFLVEGSTLEPPEEQCSDMTVGGWGLGVGGGAGVSRSRCRTRRGRGRR